MSGDGRVRSKRQDGDEPLEPYYSAFEEDHNSDSDEGKHKVSDDSDATLKEGSGASSGNTM